MELGGNEPLSELYMALYKPGVDIPIPNSGTDDYSRKEFLNMKYNQKWYSDITLITPTEPSNPFQKHESIEVMQFFLDLIGKNSNEANGGGMNLKDSFPSKSLETEKEIPAAPSNPFQNTSSGGGGGMNSKDREQQGSITVTKLICVSTTINVTYHK